MMISSSAAPASPISGLVGWLVGWGDLWKEDRLLEKSPIDEHERMIRGVVTRVLAAGVGGGSGGWKEGLGGCGVTEGQSLVEEIGEGEG